MKPIDRSGRQPDGCPACRGALEVSELTCPRCATRVKGAFPRCAVCSLGGADRKLFELFVREGGDHRAVRRALGWTAEQTATRLARLWRRMEAPGSKRGAPVTPATPVTPAARAARAPRATRAAVPAPERRPAPARRARGAAPAGAAPAGAAGAVRVGAARVGAARVGAATRKQDEKPAARPRRKARPRTGDRAGTGRGAGSARAKKSAKKPERRLREAATVAARRPARPGGTKPGPRSQRATSAAGERRMAAAVRPTRPPRPAHPARPARPTRPARPVRPARPAVSGRRERSALAIVRDLRAGRIDVAAAAALLRTRGRVPPPSAPSGPRRTPARRRTSKSGRGKA